MEIIECFCRNNDIYKAGNALKPQGIVVHSTGCNNQFLARYVAPCDDDPNKDAIIAKLGRNIYANSWNRPGVDKLVHFMVGYGAKKENGVTVAQLEPCDLKCGGVGPGTKGSYNNSHIQFEILEDDLTSEAYFNEAFDKAVELCVYLCREYGLSAADICSHKEAAERGYGWQHFDPENWLTIYGKNMDWFRARVAEKLGEEDALKVGDIVKLAPGTKTVNGVPLAGWVTDGRPVYVMGIDGDKVVITVDATLEKATGTVFRTDVNPTCESEATELPKQDAAPAIPEGMVLVDKAELDRMEALLSTYSKENAELKEKNGILEIQLEKITSALKILREI